MTGLPTTLIYTVSASHADYTVTEYGYFSSRENALAYIESVPRLKRDYEEEFVQISEYQLDKPLPAYGVPAP